MENQKQLEVILKISEKIGAHDADIKSIKEKVQEVEMHIRERLDKIDRSSTELNEKLDSLLENRSQVRGAVKVFSFIGVILACLGSFGMWLADKFWH